MRRRRSRRRSRRRGSRGGGGDVRAEESVFMSIDLSTLIV